MKTRTHSRRGDHASALTIQVSSVLAVASTFRSLVERASPAMGSIDVYGCIITTQVKHVYGSLRTEMSRYSIEFLLAGHLPQVSLSHILTATERMPVGALKIRAASSAPSVFVEPVIRGTTLQTTCGSICSSHSVKSDRPKLSVAYQQALELTPNMEAISA